MTRPITSEQRTPAQTKALRDAYVALDGQFDDLVIVCSMRADHESQGTDLEVFWKGGWPTACSLAAYAKQRISTSRRPKHGPK